MNKQKNNKNKKTKLKEQQPYGYFKWQTDEIVHEKNWTWLRKKNWISLNNNPKQSHKNQIMLNVKSIKGNKNIKCS